MHRPPRHSITHRRALAGAIVVLAALALLPARFGGWVGGFGELLSIAVRPLASPLHAAAMWLAGGHRRPEDESALAATRAELEHFRTLYLQGQERIRELEARIEQLGPGSTLPELGLRQLFAPVIGASADPGGALLRIGAGRSKGVERNALAVVTGAAGPQIVGFVSDAGATASWVLPITTRRPGRSDAIDGVILLPDGRRLLCQLYPLAGGGTLQGDVAYDEKGARPEVGMEVRANPDSTQWPRNAHMLLIGTVRATRTLPQGRHVITVEPTVRIDRLREVVLRLTTTPDVAAGAEGGEP